MTQSGDPEGGESGQPGRVRRQVDQALARLPVDWRTELARTMADAMDASPQAAMAHELRVLMGQINPSTRSAPAPEEGSKVDDLAARRAERRAAAGAAE